jgi:hypothetical protein
MLANRFGKLALDSMYGLCFRYCLSFVPRVVRTKLNDPSLRFNFIVEDGHENAGAAHEIVKRIKKLEIPGYSDCLGTATLGEKKEFPGLQAADGLAYGAWHHDEHMVDNLIDIASSPSLDAARKRTALRAPLFRCHIDAETIIALKRDMIVALEKRQTFGRLKYAGRIKGAAFPGDEVV